MGDASSTKAGWQRSRLLTAIQIVLLMLAAYAVAFVAAQSLPPEEPPLQYIAVVTPPGVAWSTIKVTDDDAHALTDPLQWRGTTSVGLTDRIGADGAVVYCPIDRYLIVLDDVAPAAPEAVVRTFDRDDCVATPVARLVVDGDGTTELSPVYADEPLVTPALVAAVAALSFISTALAVEFAHRRTRARR